MYMYVLLLVSFLYHLIPILYETKWHGNETSLLHGMLTAEDIKI